MNIKLGDGDEKSPSTPSTGDEPNYPSVYISHPNIHHLPDSGHVKVKYKVTERHARQDKTGTHHSANIALQAMEFPKKTKKHSFSSSIADQDAMQAIMNNDNNNGNN